MTGDFSWSMIPVYANQTTGAGIAIHHRTDVVRLISVKYTQESPREVLDNLVAEGI